MAAFLPPMSPPSPLRVLRAALAGLAGSLALAAPPSAQATRPDHVLWRNARGQLNTIVGKLSQDALTEVVIDTGSAQRKIDALTVERVEFGEVPQAFADAQAYIERGDAENAAAKFTLAAGDASVRAVVRARARLAAAEAWMLRAGDASALASARRECELFLAEHAASREVPAGRLLFGRLQRLAGEAAAAATTYVALYREASGPKGTPGYPPSVSFQAGLAAGEAYLAAGDAAQARELYLGLDGALGTALANLGEGDPARALLAAIQSEARLGEGFCLLAGGSTTQARTFFQGQLSGAEGNAARRFGAHLGLAEALLAEGQARAAQLEFAQVSAIDHTSQDRVARALLGLAQCALKLGERADAKAWLETLQGRHGDTPSAPKARELLATL
jgi:hypothetical protein